VVPIPLHWRRWWARGYNQSDELADALASRLGLRTVRPLRRVRATPKLAGMGRVERARNLRGAFQIRRPWSGRLAGRTILLIDDVLTSGATCGAAARTLKRAGAARVVAVVVGRAEGRV
jgi:ComF family protein